ncbi:putative rhamnogalacturonate lyase A [Psilocybe cubensis]|uniref:Rhamnogalacturonate lyase A n=2 Tax=Psilocybe cubensis TaxID=181762 RepID=A0ACB8GR00_PSICU|nr:putative rhamnogalacturonate lyase A [Psilocybe cubensis]KAH9477958.1 putative rhamnogalacturonate lyase A [Psilocybe cubensis]
MNSGHTQTEAYRTGLFGPYALWFTTGSAPSSSVIDPTFWEGLGINGLVPKASRGRVTGKASGIPSSFSSLQVVGFSNSAAQYWVRTDSSGSFTSPYMKPGTYTMTLYKSEYAVATQSVSVSAGSVVTSNIASQEANPTAIWQIGDFDGTPRGFLNADPGTLDDLNLNSPSDSRMSSWGPGEKHIFIVQGLCSYKISVTFNVGSSTNSFPMAIFKAVGAVTIRFSLSSSQIGARTLQIGTTNAFAGGRPVVQVNSWNSAIPAIPNQPDSRGVTRGTWRGNNIMYTYNIPSGTLVSGTNTIVVSVASGSSGDGFL